jgi:hypothetical protein
MSVRVCVEQIGVSDLMYEEYELIDCYKSAKLPVYIVIRKLGTQLLIRSLRFRLLELNRGSRREHCCLTLGLQDQARFTVQQYDIKG